MKKNWIIVLLISILAIGAISYYYVFNPSQKVDPFTVIPSNSIVVVEVTDPENLKKEIKEKSLSELLRNIPIGNKLSNRLLILDSLTGSSFWPKGASVISSLHRSGSEFDFIFYVPLNSISSNDDLENTLANLKDNKDVEWSERVTKGFSITGLSYKKKKENKVFFIRHLNLVIASFSEVLLEDVIAKIESRNEIPFWKKEQVKKEDDLGGKVTVYINYSQLPALLSVFSDDLVYKKLSSFAKESVLDFKLSEGQVFLNGYSYASNDFLDLFKGQLPQDFQVKNYLPLNTQSVFYLGFDKPEKLFSDLNGYFKKHDPEIISMRDSLSGKDSSKVVEIFRILRSELAICSVKDSAQEKLVFLKSVDPEALLKNILYFSGDDSLTAGGSIGKLPAKNVAQALFGRLFGGIEETYYMLLDEYVVLSGSPALLENLTLAANNENVWGKTLVYSSFLEENVSPINVGYFMNPSLIDSSIFEKSVTDRIEMVALQFSHLGGPCLTNFIVNYDPEQNEEIVEKKQDRSLAFQSPIINAIFPENGKGLFVQDSAYLHYLNVKGEIVWNYLLGRQGKISSMYAADLDLDKSQDFLFAQGNTIYALDKNGKDLKNYPLKLNDSLVIDHFSMVDYKGDKAYRLIVADRNGHVYFYDKEGNNLEGWTPRVFNGPLLERVRHMRLQGKDYILAIEKSGLVHLLNRRGEEFKNFPVNVESELTQGVLVRKGGGNENTLLMVGNKEGELFFINLNGKLNKEYDPSYFLRDERSGSSMVVRKTGSYFEVLDNQGNGQSKIHSNQKFSSVSLNKLPTKGEILVFWNADYYMIAGPGNKIIAEGRKQDIQNIKLFIHEKRNELSVFIVSSGQIDIQNFTY